jgi:hypothetical protein
VSEVGADAGGGVAFVALVVGLILKKDELVRLIIGTVVAEVRHSIKL